MSKITNLYNSVYAKELYCLAESTDNLYDQEVIICGDNLATVAKCLVELGISNLFDGININESYELTRKGVQKTFKVVKTKVLFDGGKPILI